MRGVIAAKTGCVNKVTRTMPCPADAEKEPVPTWPITIVEFY